MIRDVENPAESDFYYDHQKTPTCAKYATSGFYICSGDAIGNVRIWDTTQKEHLLKHEYRPISGAITDIAWDADSKRIAVSGDGRDKFAHAFLWDSGSSLGNLGMISKKANSVDIRRCRPYRCAVASDDFLTHFYEGPPFKHTSQFEKGTRFSNCVRFSPDGKYMATCNSDGNIFLCDGKTSEFIGLFGDPKAHNGGVYSLSFSPDSSELLSASADKTCKIWNVESRQMLVEFVLGKEVDDQQLSCLWMGDHLLSVSLAGEIKYLDRNNPSTPLRVVTGHNKSICAMTVKPQEAIFTASFDGRIVKWDVATGAGTRFTGKGHGTKISGLVYDAASNQLISVGIDNKVRFTDADSCAYAADKIIPLDSEPFSMAFTADGNLIIACEKELVLIKDGRRVSSLLCANSHHPIITAQGGKIVVPSAPTNKLGGEEQTVCFYDINGSDIAKSDAKIEVRKATALAFSADGSRLALANQKKILIYNAADGFEKEALCLDRHSTACVLLSWSPNGQHLASVGIDGKLFVWDVDRQKNDQVDRCHPKTIVRTVEWIDDNTFATAAEDCTVKQWAVEFKK